MFGYVTANFRELTKEQKARYGAIYCGICRQIQARSGSAARLGLRYDMAFLAALLMSLYEPEAETSGKGRCLVHPVTRKPWVDNKYIQYCADMNVALAYFKCLDDWEDDGSSSARLLAKAFQPALPRIQRQWKRQCDAIEGCIRQLSALEKEGCPNPDLPAACFGRLMGELCVCEEDLWAPQLRQLGDALGRFLYLMDAVMDHAKDLKQGNYNPLIAMGPPADHTRWEEYLVLTMGRCTASFERLPLVQDKDLLDNILYSGVWVQYRGRKQENLHDT